MKEELRELARNAPEYRQQGVGTLIGFQEGFEACYRLLTTPRPMSEAPRDGAPVLLCVSKTVIGGHFWTGLWTALWTAREFRSYSEHRVTGWLPIFTPMEEDETLSSLRRGLEQAAAGQVNDLGSFAQYAEEEVANG